MTSAQPNDDMQERLNRVEEMLIAAGNTLGPTFDLAQRNATDIERLNQRVNQGFITLTHSAITLTEQMSMLTQQMSGLARRVDSIAQGTDGLTQQMSELTERVNSLAAAGERHDRILDYLLRREAGDIDLE